MHGSKLSAHRKVNFNLPTAQSHYTDAAPLLQAFIDTVNRWEIMFVDFKSDIDCIFRQIEAHEHATVEAVKHLKPQKDAAAAAAQKSVKENLHTKQKKLQSVQKAFSEVYQTCLMASLGIENLSKFATSHFEGMVYL